MAARRHTLEVATAAGVSAVALGLYVRTLAPTVTLIDSGELILAAHSAGIRIRLPRPSTLVCRSLVDVRFGTAFRTCISPPALPPATAPFPPPAEAPPAAELEQGCSSFFSRSCRGKLGRRPPPASPVISMVNQAMLYTHSYLYLRVYVLAG
jgi:hypothetical protein